MIEFIGKPGSASCSIQFSPRSAYKCDPRYQRFEKDLVYGHYCPTCGNVVQACFLTAKPVDLWFYEETNVISTAADEKKFGNVLKIVPNQDSKFGYSQYTSTVLRTPGGMAQHLTLKNHIVKYHGINETAHTSDRYFEPGGHTCAYTGLFSLREDLALKDLCLLWRFADGHGNNLNDYKFGKIDEVLDHFITNDGAHLNGLSFHGVRALPAYGQAPPVLVFPRDKLTGNYAPWGQISTLMSRAFKKEQNV